MKPKQLKSKLNVKRETISNLNGDQLNEVRGGVAITTRVTLCVTYCGGATCGYCPTDCTSNWVCSC